MQDYGGLGCDVVEQDILEGLHIAQEVGLVGRLVLLLVVVYSGLDDVAQEACFRRHELRQFARRGDLLGRLLTDDVRQFDEACLVAEAYMLALYLRQMDGHHPLAVLVEFEVEIVGEDDGIERCFVSVELLFVLPAPVEVSVLEVLCLDKSDGKVVAQECEVGRTAVDMALLVDHRTLAEVLEKFLQGGAE